MMSALRGKEGGTQKVYEIGQGGGGLAKFDMSNGVSPYISSLYLKGYMIRNTSKRPI